MGIVLPINNLQQIVKLRYGSFVAVQNRAIKYNNPSCAVFEMQFIRCSGFTNIVLQVLFIDKIYYLMEQFSTNCVFSTRG